MYSVQRNGRSIFEADACGIGFLASRKGVAQRELVEQALALTKHFDHRGAPGHGAGLQLDIPWALLVDRFPKHGKLIVQHDVALGMFFLPFEARLRQKCIEEVERIAALAGATCLDWADVPLNDSALPDDSSAKRTIPKVRQAIFKRPDHMSEDGWFACRYLLRLAIDRKLHDLAGDEFAVVSLSNRTVVYKGLSELSKIGILYPDLANRDFQSRFVLFHSRYCTNTTTAWRRAQPFWGIAHNGEISTISGNVSWMQAIGKDLIRNLIGRFPQLQKLSEHVESIICAGGSDTANLDDMTIALIAGGMSFPQSLLALLPSAESALEENDPLRDFFAASRIYLGACDGPAAIVGCDGDVAVAHLDRNGLRPLWSMTTKDYVLAVSELTGTTNFGEIEDQRVLGPGETMIIDLRNGRVLSENDVKQSISREPYPMPFTRIKRVPAHEGNLESTVEDLSRVQKSFGMTKEDVETLVIPMGATGYASIGAMGDDTSPAAMLDLLPRRIEDHFKLRFAQETSPPIDPVRDAWVFDGTATLGDRSGLWVTANGPLFEFPYRVLGLNDVNWLTHQTGVKIFSLLVDKESDIDEALSNKIDEILKSGLTNGVIILNDQAPTETQIALPSLRVVSKLHDTLVKANSRHRFGILADVGIWDVHHCALHITLGADAVCPWLGIATCGAESEGKYLSALRAGVIEAMSMMGVTPSSAYCGAKLIEAIGLDRAFLEAEFVGVPGHISGISTEDLNLEWKQFHTSAFTEEAGLSDAGEYRHTRDGRPHFNNAGIVRSLQSASGYTKKIHEHKPGTKPAYDAYSTLVSERSPITLLDLLQIKQGDPIPIEEVDSVESILWRFMAPGMSEGALSEPAHRAVARAFNITRRYCLVNGYKGKAIGPISNSGEGGFDKSRMLKNDGNRSIQYAGGRFTVTPFTASTAAEAEVKFAQGAKPGKGGQLPGKKVSPMVANRRGCEPGFELVSPPINHNLYSIEDVKLLLESWRFLNPEVNCALKFVATTGVEMVAVGGVNAGANRIHISDGCGGTGAAKRVDQKHAGLPVVAVLPTVQDLLVEEGIRHLVELSVDGGVQNGEQALKLFLLGADKVGFGTSLLVAIGCSMLRKCNLSGPDPSDPSGKKRLGCTPGIATQDPEFISRFTGKGIHIARFLRFIAEDVRQRMADAGIRTLDDSIGQRNLLDIKPNRTGKAAKLDLSGLVNAPGDRCFERDYAKQSRLNMPPLDEQEVQAGKYVSGGKSLELERSLTNADRCVGVSAAGVVARCFGDQGLPSSTLTFINRGSAGHFYGAYAVNGLEFHLRGNIADSGFSAAYGGLLSISPPHERTFLALVGNCFGYGARGGKAFIAGKAGNRFGICLRKNHEGGGPLLVVEGVGANAFQYMTGGIGVILGSFGPNLGSGMSGGKVYILEPNQRNMNDKYAEATELNSEEGTELKHILEQHVLHTESNLGKFLLCPFDPARFKVVKTKLKPEWLPEWNQEAVSR
jgi:glutamate synthase domain-containing protein 2/glutamate synthase domain-containing protein 1/glutamate synthase domain-containing protein 3